jgi:hypothetical protein
MAKQAKQTESHRVRPDGRKPFLAYLPKDVIRDLKVAAIEEDRHAYLVTEDAIRSYLRRKQSVRKGRT